MATQRSADPVEAVFDHIEDGADLIVPLANGEPVTVLDAIEAGADRLRGVRVHQMHALHDRPYLHGAIRDHLLHVSYFLSPITRPAFHEGGVRPRPDPLQRGAPASSGRPRGARWCSRRRRRRTATATSPSAPTPTTWPAFIGRAPFFLEVNPQMPRTFGGNQLHVSQVAGWIEVDRPLVEVPPTTPSEVDERIAAHVAERIPDGATIQAGIGSIPSALLAGLRHHRTSASTPSCSPTAFMRPDRARRRHRHPEAPLAGQGRHARSRSARRRSTTSCTRTPRSSSCPSTT